jgi:hypothetical protein|tara:strand:- start:90 stop:1061 length:972 start_codon:yes stop_codon:yes gene_type:complete
MCDPVSIGIATFAVGSISTVANYQQQQQAATFADTQAFNQMQAANRAAESQAAFNQSQALFNMQQQNAQIGLANQRTLNEWVLNTQQTNTSNARIQREFMMAQQQNNFTNLQNQLQFQSQLNQSILSEIQADNQKRLNQLNLNARLEESQNKKNAAQAQRAFEAERLMASSIASQGSLLAQGRSGQSVGLGVLNEGAKYGRDMRMAERNYSMAVNDFYADNTNAFLQQAQADAEAIASIMPRPTDPISLPDVAPPVFSEYAPDPVFADFITDPGPLQGPSYAAMPTASPRPGALGLVAGIGGAAVSGVTAGYQFDSLIKNTPD